MISLVFALAVASPAFKRPLPTLIPTDINPYSDDLFFPPGAPRPYGHPQSFPIPIDQLKSTPPLTLMKCADSAVAYQRWSYNATSAARTIYLTEARAGVQYCVDVAGFNPDVNATVYTWPCGQGSSTNEFWNIGDNWIQSIMNPGQKCLGIHTGFAAFEGAIISTLVCNHSDPDQQLKFDSVSGRITHIPTGLCVDAGSNPVAFCSGTRLSWPFCNDTYPIDDRAADIISRLSLEDKIRALGTDTPTLPSIGMTAYNWWSEATHGISHVNYDTRTPFASNTALPITTARSFNRTLWHATGALIGREARAFQNVGNAFNTFWAPVINIVRDPRWGRNIETAGEDPFVSGQYAINFVKGFQESPEDPYTLQASACCKHYIANELDGWNGTDRQHFDAIVTQQDLGDSYMPPFQACVQQGRVSSLMCSYNAVNGIPSCANHWLLQTVARDTWQFDGYITSDCDADYDVFFSHHYTDTPEEAVREVLRAGTDIDCGSFVPQYAASALQKGTITEDDIDLALRRLFRLRLRLGVFDSSNPMQRIGTDQICTPAAVETARDGARQGTVLLKNNGTLPLDPAAFKSVAVIGPNGLLSSDIAYYYGGQPCFMRFYTVVDAISQYVPGTTFSKGVPSVSSDDESLIKDAVAAAQAADLVVFAIGSDLSLEAEGHDRTEIGFSKGQLALVSAVTQAVSVPCVAVILTAGALDVTPLLQNNKISAIVEAGQPSVQIIAVGDILFGKAVPAGRMIQTTYPASFVNDVSLFDFNMRPGPSVWPPFSNPGRTYRFYTGKPVFPFGYGLSYTTFKYSVVEPSTTSVSLAAARRILSANSVTGHIPEELLEVAASYYVNVTNTGSRDADDVVLGFIVPPSAGKDGVPLKVLFGFQRVFVPAGSTVTVYIGAQGDAFTQVNVDGVREAWPGTYRVQFGVPETVEHGMGFTETTVVAE